MRTTALFTVASVGITLLVGPGCGGSKASTTTTGTGGSTGSASSTSTGGATTTGTGAAASTGTGAASTTATAGTGAATTTGSAGTGGGPAPQACQTPPCLNVINDCPFPLWIHASSNAGVTLTPDDAKLATGAVQQFAMPASWPAARVNAYWEDPTSASSDPNAYDKVELTVGGGSINYDITYVDYLALPSRMEAIDPSCPKTGTFDPVVACTVPVASVLTGCPAGLLSGKRCLSAGLFCSDAANQGSAYCHALDTPIATCEQQAPATCGIAGHLGNETPNAYSCSGYFDSQTPAGCTGDACHVDGNEWCAALNRGMLAQPMSTDATQYYQTAPYNTYARWVHTTCPGIYAFAYDDYPSTAGQSGDRSCTTERLDITFCPGG